MSETASIADIENEIVEEFSFLDDWDDKYTYVIELGRKLEPFPEEHRKDENIIKGCQSRVWLHSYTENGKVYFKADSDAMIVKGLVYLLVRTLSGHAPDEIIKTDLSFLDKIGMKQHLSPTRSNGLLAMVKQMKLHALAYKSKISE
ncbi:SufE family protein [Cytophagaceae bacterium ABcell3]|nr:SufE family protein [Cytophagaceae bacterium ABcell3]